jgi:membrane protein DedA with SNARE-associated domain
MKYYLRLLSIPLLFFVLYTSLFLIWDIFNLPSTEELTSIVGDWFDKYGIPVLLFGSILEGMLLIGSYFPGVFVIFLGVIVADSPLEAVMVIVVATIGLLIAHAGNYFLGKYGWYRLLVKFGVKEAVEQAKKRLEKRGPIAIPLSYWLPSIGALTDTAAGIIQLSFRKFMTYSIVSSVFWYPLVGFVVYMIGDSALSIATGGTGMVVMYSIIGLWVITLLVVDHFEKRNQS